MGHLEDIRTCIQNTIGQVISLKCFIESVVANIGEPNDTEKIQEIKKKADAVEKEIDENIQRLSKVQGKYQFNTSRKILMANEEKQPKRVRKAAGTFEICFKHYMHLYSMIESHSVQGYDLKKSLDEMKTSVCRRKAIKGIEHFEFQRDERKNAFRVKVKFNFGIDLIVFSEDGTVKNYFFKLAQDSLNLKQLLSMLELKWEYEIDTKERHLIRCLNSAADWIFRHRGIYTEKCKVCDLHLSFKSGRPMIPLVSLSKHYYHVDCYFDLNIEIA